jgi:cytochrome P450
MVVTDDVPSFPMPRAAGCPFDPPPVLRSMQQNARLGRVRIWNGATAWVVTRYADQRALLSDPRVSADVTRPGFPAMSAGVVARRKNAVPFISVDDPEHARLRRMVTSPFTVKQVEKMRLAVQRIVDDLIDRMLAGPKPADLVEVFALPVPSLVVCELLGVPYEDRDVFQSSTRAMVVRDGSPEEQAAAQGRILAYLEGLVSRKLGEPGDDLLCRIAVEQVVPGVLSTRDAAAMGMLLLVAGHETTSNMIALGTLALLRHPQQLAELRVTEDGARIARAVDELLRYLTITHSGRRRIALEDIELGSDVIRAGDGLIFPNDIGNRDPAIYPDPDRLDTNREALGHLAFGFGPHQCLGQNLARMELQVVYGTLYRRIPNLALATDFDQVRFKHGALAYGVDELPVTW